MAGNKVIKGNIRRGNYGVQEILSKTIPYAEGPRKEGVYDGVAVYLQSNRYDTFRKSTECHVCGIKGEYMGLDSGHGCRQEKRGHFNLYAVGENGEEILMTKGSKLDPRGYKTTCAHCAKELDKVWWYSREVKRC